MTAPIYSAEVLRRCRQLERAGSWPEDDAAVGTGAVGSLDAGTLTRLQVHVAGGRVDDARFKVFGCSAAIASASLAADRAVGRSLDEARAIGAAAIAEALELPSDKQAMAAQATAALRAAVDDWERKHAAAPASAGAATAGTRR